MAKNTAQSDHQVITNQALRQSLRATIRSRRQNLNENQQTIASQGLFEQLTHHKKILQSQTIALYLANDGELDTHLFIDWCWQQNKTVCLPVLHPFSHGNLLFIRYDKQTKLRPNKYGIAEPEIRVDQVIPIARLDVICTPLVAFDTSGARLGMGGGFYDRTLQTWYQQFKDNRSIKPYPIGLAHECQLVDKIPCEIWDIPIPEIITPSKTFNILKS